MANKVYVGNLTPDVTEDDLRDAFARFGGVDQVFMKQGFGFVHMQDDDSASDAINSLNGGNIGPAQGVRVGQARGSSRGGGGGFGGGGRGGGGGNACYNCGQPGHFSRECPSGGGGGGGYGGGRGGGGYGGQSGGYGGGGYGGGGYGGGGGGYQQGGGGGYGGGGYGGGGYGGGGGGRY